MSQVTSPRTVPSEAIQPPHAPPTGMSLQHAIRARTQRDAFLDRWATAAADLVFLLAAFGLASLLMHFFGVP